MTKKLLVDYAGRELKQSGKALYQDDASGMLFSSSDGASFSALGMSFSANLGGTSFNQTGIALATQTKLKFAFTDWNDGNLFDTTNYRWVPPAGRVRMFVNAGAYNLTGVDSIAFSIWKNGALWKNVVYAAPIAAGTLAGYACLNGSAVDIANGTDYYEVFVIFYGSTGTPAIQGNVINTVFSGMQF